MKVRQRLGMGGSGRRWLGRRSRTWGAEQTIREGASGVHAVSARIRKLLFFLCLGHADTRAADCSVDRLIAVARFLAVPPPPVG